MKELYKKVKYVWLGVVVFLMALPSVSAQTPPPGGPAVLPPVGPGNSGGIEGSGGSAPLGDNLYLWLIPVILYVAYKVWQYHIANKQVNA